MYLRSAKTEAEDAGIDTDGMADSVSKLREDLLSLTGNQVDIQLDEDTFKSTYQILKEISGVWDSLTDITQANILEKLGGKRNSNVVAALIDNFGTAESVLDYTANAEGSALAENEKYLESIEGHIQNFKVAFEDLSMNIIGTDMVKGVVDFGTGLVNAANVATDIAQTFGGLKGLLISLGGTATSLFGTKAISSIINKIKMSALQDGTLSNLYQPAMLAKYHYGQLSRQSNAEGDTRRRTKIRNATRAAEITWNGMSTLSKVSTAFTGISAAVGLASAAYNTYKQNQEEAMQSAAEGLEIYKETESSIDNYQTKLRQLVNSYNSGELSESESLGVRSEIFSVLSEINDSYGVSLNFNKLITGELETQLNLLTEIGNQNYENWKQENKDTIDESVDQIIHHDTLTGSSKFKFTGRTAANTKDGTSITDIVTDILGEDNVTFSKDNKGVNTTFAISTDMDSKTAYAKLSELYSTLEGYRDEYDSDDAQYDIFDNWLSSISDLIGDVSEHNDTYWSNFETYTRGEIAEDKDLSDDWGLYSDRLENLKTLKSEGKDTDAEYNSTKQALEDLLGKVEDGDSANKDAYMALLRDELRNLEKEYGTSDEYGINLKDSSDKVVKNLQKGVERFRSKDNKIDLDKVSDIMKKHDLGRDDLISSEDLEAFTALEDAAKKGGFRLFDGSADVESFVNWFNGLGTIDEIFQSVDDMSTDLKSLISGDVSSDKTKGEIDDIISEFIRLDNLEMEGFDINKALGLDELGITFDQLKGRKSEVGELIKGLGLNAEESAGQIALLSGILSALGYSDEEIELLFTPNEESAEEAGEEGAEEAQKGADKNPVDTKTNPPDTPDQPDQPDTPGTVDAPEIEADTDGAKEQGVKTGDAYIDGLIDTIKNTPTEGFKLPEDGEEEPKPGLLKNEPNGNTKGSKKEGKKDGEAYSEGFNAGASVDGTIDPDRGKIPYSNEDAAFKGGQKDRESYTKGYTTHTGKKLSGNTKQGSSGTIADSPVISPQSDMTEFESGVRQTVAELESTPVSLLLQTQVDEASEMTTMEKIRHKNSGTVTPKSGDTTENHTVNVTFNPSDAESKITAISEAMNNMPTTKDATLTVKTGDALIRLQNIRTIWNSLNNKEITLTITGGNALGTYHRLISSIPKSGKTGMTKHEFGTRMGSLQNQSYKETHGEANALGTLRGAAYAAGSNQVQRNAVSLVGELGQEMLVRPSTGEWKTIGDRGPEFIPILKGDIIFNARQTRELLSSGKLHSYGSTYGSAFANGTATSLSPFTGSKGRGNINVNITATADADISESLEEELGKIKEEVDEVLGNFEHEITIGEYKNAPVDQMIAIYKKMQGEVHKRADAYRAKGLNDNSDYIQDLQKQYFEYAEAIEELMTNQFEDTRKNYENAIELTETWIDNAVDKGDYDRVLKYSQDLVSYYRSLQEELHQQAEYYRSLGYSDTSDEVSELSKLWWEYENNVNDATEEAYEKLIEKATEALNEIRDVYDELYAAADEYSKVGFIDIDTFSSIADIGVEYLDLLRDENGLLVINEESINNMVAAKTRQLGIETALNYIAQLRAAMTKQDYNELQRLLKATTAVSDANWDLVYSQLSLLDLNSEQYKQAKERIDYLYSLSEATAKGVGKTTDEVTDSLDTILDYVMEIIRHEVDEKIEALEDQVDKYNEIIDKQKESLRLTKEQEEYDEDVADKLKEINKIQDQIDLLSLDDSLEAKAKRKELEEDLADLQKELADKQKDRAYDVITEALDKSAEDFSEKVDDEIEDLQDSISSTQKVYDLAIKKIRETTWDDLYKELIDWNYEFGDSLTQNVITAWNQATEAAKEYGGYLEYLEKTGMLITSDNIDPDSDSDRSTIVAPKLEYEYYPYGNDPVDWLERMRANSEEWMTATAERRSVLDKENLDLGELLGDYLGAELQRGSNGVWYIGSQDKGKRLYDYEFDESQRTADFSAAGNLLSQMIANANAWHNSDDATRSKLAASNEQLAKSISDLIGYDLIKETSTGVWYIGDPKNGVKLFDISDIAKLNDKSYVYHSGGIVGDVSTVKQNEVMALLEKGELVLDKEKEDALYTVIDFADMLSKKLGKDINLSELGKLGGSVGLSNSLVSMPDVGNITNNNTITFSPNVEVNITHSGSLDNSDAAKFGKITANAVIDEINDAFQRRGISSITNASLK